MLTSFTWRWMLPPSRWIRVLQGAGMPSKPRSDRPGAPYHHGDLRRALIDAALTIVTEEGAWNFTLREVARRAGVSHAAPYNHFADKTALLAEVAALGFRAPGAGAVGAARPPRRARQALGAIPPTYVRRGAEHPAHSRRLLGPEAAHQER